jgi:arylsulfatase A-like enzyme
MSEPERPPGTVRLALAVGMVGGILLGVREGLATFAANAFADPGQHGIAYLVVPVAVWFVLGPLVLLPVAAVGRLTGRGGVPFLAAALATIGVVLATLPPVESGLAQARAVGAAPGTAMTVMLALSVVALAVAAGAVARAAGASLTRHATYVLPLAAATGVAALVWSGRFLAAGFVPEETAGSGRPASVSPAPAGAPNVVIVSIDTLRADALGAYGNAAAHTLALDRLAAEGVTFEQAISPAPWTLPALASVMTGLYPRHHGAGAIANRRDPLGRTPLAPGVQTLAETFAQRGYRTHAIVTNPYLLAGSGLAAGFESYENLTFLSEAMVAGRTNAAQWLLDHLAPRLVVGDRGVEVSDWAVRWLEHVDADRPFFLWLHYIDPHGPYGGTPGARHKTFRGDSSFGATAGHDLLLDGHSPDPVRLRSGEVRLDDAEKRGLRALYDGEVTEVDRQVGRVLEALDRRGLAAGTLVVCVSDHGEEFWEHGGVEHGHTLYDELLHVVLLMRWPGHLQAGLRVPGVASSVDIAPTIRELVGLPDPGSSDGVSLVAGLRGAMPSPRAVISENLLFAEERVALRTDGAKLIRWANGKEEAYDLRRDPAERRDLAGVDGFVARLEAAFDETEQAMAPAVTPVAGREVPAAALRALGYVD